MSAISSLFPESQRLLLLLQNKLEAYESLSNATSTAALATSPFVQSKTSSNNNDDTFALLTATEREISHLISQLSLNVREMESMVNMEGSRREMWKSRIQSMSDQAALIRSSFIRTQQRLQNQRANETRNALFNGHANVSRFQQGIDALHREGDSLSRSNNMVDELTAMGRSTLQSLHTQRHTMKSAKRKALDVANLLGMSSSVVHMIERKENMNAIITYGCMILTVIILMITYYYFRT